jgi:hypothetical protein
MEIKIMAKVTAPPENLSESKQQTPSTDLKSLSSNSNRVDEKLMQPGKYEITDNDVFKIEFGVKQVDKRWVVVDKTEKPMDSENHWVEFRMWNFEEEIELRKQSTIYDPLKRMHFVDNDKLNRLKIQKLLKAWSFEKGNERLKLFHVNGVLVDESYGYFMKLYPTILRFILEKMNDVLEYNG